MDTQDDLVFEKLSDLLENLQYGSVTIFVQDGKVVQMEKNEKVRVGKTK
ncbi:YezD family protein [Alkalicoccobacillus plakortidis]|uniref:YezD family protein n=1 Tax=Alkalicoccobacillus plakortidis TaxID=444060 RepID=A0ABT0XR34_9BACI|nr:YezD family protein [Alkalicoccobacillus plakortidis]MCM2677757.1 YezD family protein [Alkalicoccobacillus plakortidis]